MNPRPLLIVSLVTLLAGCVSPHAKPAGLHPAAPVLAVGPATPGQLKPEWLRPSMKPFTLGPGDRVEIEIVGDASSRAVTLVAPDGRIFYHVLPGIDVWGLTPAEVRTAVERELSKLYREPPRVTVTLREVGSKRVWLLGRLNAPGIYPLTGPTTLLEAISRAGGPAPTPMFASLTLGGAATFSGGSDEAADLSRAFVIRAGQVLPVNFEQLLRAGDLSQNIYLEPDDLVYLPSAVSQEVYLLGAVGQPKAVNYTAHATLVSSIAAAGGTAHDAYLTNVAIVRGGLSAPQIAVIDYKAIVSGRATDVPLEANDIVYVPLTPYHVLTRYLDLILSTFARTVGVNAGARAVARGQAIGISVPVGPGP